MQQWIKKIVPDKSKLTFIPGFKKYMQDPELWKFARESVARGVAVGLFAAFLPVMPFQMIAAVILAVSLSANIPMAILFCWANNPFTIVPITYLSFSVGKWIFDEDGKTIKTIHVHYSSIHEFITSSLTWLIQNGKVFIVGLPIAAVGVSLIGYILVDLFWEISIFLKKMLHKK